MAKSYIPEGTNVICTLMQKGPNKIGIARSSYVIHTNKKAPLLNINDKKISASFSCKNASKFWGGLSTLCTGIAIGALIVAAVAATVLTGGAAAVFIVAAAATLTVSAGAAVTGLYKAAHDCDVTKDSTWMLEHQSVKIDGAKALLNPSILNCLKGGKVNLILDSVIAQQAAEQIISNNKKEVSAHLSSQFVMGLITGATSASPVALAIASPLAIYSYVTGESEALEDRANAKQPDSLLKEAGKTTVQELRDGGAGAVGDFYEMGKEVTVINQGLNREVVEYTAQAATREAAGDLAGAASSRLAADIASRSYQMPWKGMAKGFGIGLAAGVVNFGIDQSSNAYEDAKYKASNNTSDQLNDLDSKNSIGVNSL